MLLVVSRSDVRFGFDHPFFARPKSRAPKKKFANQLTGFYMRGVLVVKSLISTRVRARVYVFS